MTPITTEVSTKFGGSHFKVQWNNPAGYWSLERLPIRDYVEAPRKKLTCRTTIYPLPHQKHQIDIADQHQE
ncbi:hypothetical protein F441_14178 [Phytophthora nicotianae CJ01A1]|uniref:Uncharacterized protein n=4 Tax=Phytophthora nicotianae TaxID=4792 RepID=W2YW51_PHYNI|nr:hypothetical protein L915_13919 [Phytophthora nicotianae]ETO68984.1 hypothetical protein F444_14299 [Phytophthora nicotianae P1976]ETP10093.1 hypothetical protein F441_14178 [Phytophthora nicotianae CJ01A1]ETP38179.1 hypothetical protein F442_14123 [Phytophthora nicotianae P10297]ETL33817.1 hypothetical protein L916_13815 [Phytophthora nicotianae]